MNKFDPATFREAARQLREEAEELDDFDVAPVLRTLADRFDAEAKAAEKAKGE